MLKVLGIAVFVLAAGVYSGAAYADPIGGPDSACGSCQGSIYTLTYDTTPEATLGNGNKVYDVTLTVDTSGYSGGGTQLRAVAIKVTSLDQTGPASELDSTNAPGTWVYQAGGINAGSGLCDGSGNGFECASANPGPTVPTGTVYSWTFDVETDSRGLFTGLLAPGCDTAATFSTHCASIKAAYTDNDGNKVGALVSENIQLQEQTQPLQEPVPEPTTLLLAGTALAGIGVWGRKWWLERRAA